MKTEITTLNEALVVAKKIMISEKLFREHLKRRPNQCPHGAFFEDSLVEGIMLAGVYFPIQNSINWDNWVVCHYDGKLIAFGIDKPLDSATMDLSFTEEEQIMNVISSVLKDSGVTLATSTKTFERLVRESKEPL